MRGRRFIVACAMISVITITLIAASFTINSPMTGSSANDTVTLIRAPNSGLQPQAVMDASGALHLVYFAGEPGAGDVFYVRRERGKGDFSSPIRVNSQPGSAIATGTI